MKTIKEDDIFKLRQSGKVKTKDGSNLKSVLPLAHKRKPEAIITPEERTSNAIEGIVSKLAKALQDNDKNAILLMDMIRKVIIKPDVKIPAFPDFPAFPAFPVPVRKWKFTVERDNQGFIEEIKAEAVT